MQIPAEQPFVPVITGGDVGAYSWAREFHEAFGVVSAVVPTRLNRNLKHSRILDAFPAGVMTDEQTTITALIDVAERLTDSGANPRPLVLLATYDHIVQAVLRHREELERWYVIPFPDRATVEQVADKESFAAICRRLGIPHPRETRLSMAEHDPARTEQIVAATLDELGADFPLILKAADSWAWAQTTFAGRRKVHRVEDAAELGRLLDAAAGAGFDDVFLLQELIPGPDSQMRVGSYFRDAAGRIRLRAVGEVLLEDHAPGLEGNSRAILTSADPRIDEHAETFLHEVDWHGFAMFDVKIDPRDGSPQFFEMNPRLGRNHFYLTAGGVNPAELVVQQHLAEALTGADVEPPRELPETTRPDALHTTVPLSLARRFADADQRARVDAAARAGAVHSPFRYRPDPDLRKRAYHAAVLLKSLREVRQHPPA